MRNERPRILRFSSSIGSPSFPSVISDRTDNSRQTDVLFVLPVPADALQVSSIEQKAESIDQAGQATRRERMGGVDGHVLGAREYTQ
jgi:hypothetical protein